MNEDQIKSLIDQLKAQGLDDEKIMDTFYKTFEKGEMDRKDLETLANALGYELTDDFKNDETPDPIASDDSGDSGDGKVSAEEAEDLKALDEDESPEEFKDRVDEAKDDDSDDEDKEWEKAQKLFRI